MEHKLILNLLTNYSYVDGGQFFISTTGKRNYLFSRPSKIIVTVQSLIDRLFFLASTNFFH